MACDYAHIGGNVVRYTIEGDGPPLVLVHEMTGSMESWDAVVPRLPGHRILRFDMRGHGGSQKIVERITLSDLTNDLAALQDAVGFTDPAVVAGVAVGGALALALAAWWPQRVTAAVAFSPAVGVPPDSRPERHRNADALERDGMSSILESAFDNGFPEKYRVGREAEFRIFHGRLAANDSRSMAYCFRMLADMEPDAFLSAIERPVHIVGCSDDVIRPPAIVKPLAERIPGARYSEIESGHHSAQLTPDRVAEVVARVAEEAA